MFKFSIILVILGALVVFTFTFLAHLGSKVEEKITKIMDKK